MENLESFQFPRGGPIYIEDLVGPLTRVPHFQSSLDEELRSLKAELDSCVSDEDSDFDLSVDELRLLSEEELVDMALKQALLVETSTVGRVEETEVLEENFDVEGRLVEGDGECRREDTVEEEENGRDVEETVEKGALRNGLKRKSELCNEGLDERDNEGKICRRSKKKGINTIDDDTSVAELENDGETQMENASLGENMEWVEEGVELFETPQDIDTIDKDMSVTELEKDGETQMEIISLGKSTEGVEDGAGLFERPHTRSRTAVSESKGRKTSKKAISEKDDVGEQGENVKKRRKGKMSKSNGALGKYPEKRRKRGRLFDRETRAAELENPIFIEKVEQLARIKQKQDEDKTAARLHSYNGARKVNGAIISSLSENVGKVKSLRSVASSTKVRNSCNALQYTPITHSEVLLSVEVYNQKVKTQELLVLGSQMLSDLRDHIYCSTDDLMQKAGKHDPSGYFLIEEVFCNDKRDPFAIDYSQPILEWLGDSKNDAHEKWECVLSGELQQKQRALFGESPSPPLPQFKAVEMHRIRFCDISFRLGAGYMYCHQGDCKHLIVIRDMRRIHPEDVQNRASYPVVTFQLKTRFHKCDVCNIYRATKVTVDDKWARENPCHFCDNCYYLLHYGEDGSLLYNDFTVHDYHHG